LSSNWVGETRAFPSTRMVTTAGATVLTMSAYESRPPAIDARAICGAASAAMAADTCGSAARPCHAVTPVTRRPTAAAATPAWKPRLPTYLLMSMVLWPSIEDPSCFIRREGAFPGRCWNITCVRGREGREGREGRDGRRVRKAEP